MQNYTDVEIDHGIRIKGTEYDRRRALTDDEQDYAIYLFKVKGYTLARIAKIMGMSVPGIFYIVNEDYRERKKEYERSHPSYVDAKTANKIRKSRITYKRQLLKDGLVTIGGIK